MDRPLLVSNLFKFPFISTKQPYERKQTPAEVSSIIGCVELTNFVPESLSLGTNHSGKRKIKTLQIFSDVAHSTLCTDSYRACAITW